VPEIGNDPRFARHFFAVLGNQGIGFVPFGLDFTGYANYPLGAPAIDENLIESFAANYKLLEPWMSEWARLSFETEVWGGAEPDDRAPQEFDLGAWTASIRYGKWSFGGSDWTFLKDKPMAVAGPDGGAVIARLGANEFLVTGRHSRVEFGLGKNRKANGVIFDKVEEIHFENGKWITDRIWNGDQTDWGLNFTELPQILRVRLATY
jgi:beta-galactosidase GanA